MDTGMNKSLELRKFVVPELVMGQGASLLINRYAMHFGARKALLVTDKHLRKQPWFQEIIEAIEQAEIETHLFDDVSCNPKDYEVMIGAEQFLGEECDIIVAIGGGSPMDCAKGIGIVSTNGGHILDYVGVDEIKLPGPPLICIPTTAGTSADVSQFAIIADTSENIKKAIISKKVVPDLALIDNNPLKTMDPYLTACTGMDSLTHAIEACVSNARSDLTHVHALESVRMITNHLEAAVQPDRSVETLWEMMVGTLHAGFAFSNASLGAVHAMAHSLGGLYDLPHGECNGILLEKVIEANFQAAEPYFRQIAEKMDLSVANMNTEEACIALVERIRQLRRKVGIPDYLPMESIDEIALEKLTENALQDPCMVTNPKIMAKEEVKKIYGQLFKEKKQS
ncbi:alcohol dehydrogenase-like regulatory protein ErcA [Tindallia californiensis]|uniref:Alcohol dehydrogenase, class IV n=1 Tax=Tindallia californiensis TaxID=159292 RepID=A0A1H3Q846_9FIRM|nr:alcohol dehydrogenase-like regulatory protein ErcA [Tindallia californiensis]SDZ09433.1 Alcohol dehydrogenase, class IV [Tindallia californiensis]